MYLRTPSSIITYNALGIKLIYPLAILYQNIKKKKPSVRTLPSSTNTRRGNMLIARPGRPTGY